MQSQVMQLTLSYHEYSQQLTQSLTKQFDPESQEVTRSNFSHASPNNIILHELSRWWNPIVNPQS